MRFDLSSISYAARAECAAMGLPIKLGHAQELLAAALGCRTFAALQAAVRPPNEVGHVFFNSQRLEMRVAELGYAPAGWAAPIRAALVKQVPEGHLHITADTFFNALYQFVDYQTVNDPEVTSQTAMTNGYLGEVYMPLYLDGVAPFEDTSTSLDIFDPDVSEFSFDISGYVSMEQDDEKPYVGHKVIVQATLEFTRLADGLFSNPALKVSHAKLQWGDEDEDRDQAPLRSEAEVLAEEMGLTEEEARYLQYRVDSNESDDGFVFSEIIVVAPTNPKAVLKKVMAKHRTLSVHVSPGFFENVMMED